MLMHTQSFCSISRPEIWQEFLSSKKSFKNFTPSKVPKEVKEMCGSREAESGTSEGFVKALAIFLTLTPVATT